MDATDAPKGELTLRTLAMPRDVNTNGDIFGGWVLSQMDMAAGIVAGARAQGRVATVAIDAMQFIRPVSCASMSRWSGSGAPLWAYRLRPGRYAIASRPARRSQRGCSPLSPLTRRANRAWCQRPRSALR